MSLQAHLVALEEKHQFLEAQVAAESARPMPNFLLITQWKKQKLRLKQEISELASALPQHKASTS